MRKGPTSGADSVVFDLEDAVAPPDRPEARRAVYDVLTDETFDPDCEVVVRVSLEETTEDVDALLDGADRPRLDALMLPKTESAADVDWLADLLAEHDASRPIVALCETAAGILHAEEIACADATAALAFGAEDLSADIGANRTHEGTEVLYAREHVVLAARVGGVDAIDTVFTAIEDTDRLADETAFARDLGYDGKIAIHPAQVPVINDGFTPTEEQVAWARRVVDAVAASDAGVIRVDDEMVDAPLLSRAKRVLERAGESPDGTGS